MEEDSWTVEQTRLQSNVNNFLEQNGLGTYRVSYKKKAHLLGQWKQLVLFLFVCFCESDVGKKGRSFYNYLDYM